MGALGSLLGLLRRRLLGFSPEALQASVEDVRAELQATRAELEAELAEVRREVAALPRGGEDRVKGPEIPVAEA